MTCRAVRAGCSSLTSKSALAKTSLRLELSTCANVLPQARDARCSASTSGILSVMPTRFRKVSVSGSLAKVRCDLAGSRLVETCRGTLTPREEQNDGSSDRNITPYAATISAVTEPSNVCFPPIADLEAKVRFRPIADIYAERKSELMKQLGLRLLR